MPAVPNLRKKLTSKSWSGLRWQEETRQSKKRDKNAEADDKKVELVSSGQWGCPVPISIESKYKRETLETLEVSILSTPKSLHNARLKMRQLKMFCSSHLLVRLGLSAPSSPSPNSSAPFSIMFVLSRFKLRDLHCLLCLVLNTLQMW